MIGALAEDANSELGSWRARGNVEDVHPLLPALREALPQAEISVTGNDIAAAVAAARQADLVLLVVGEDFDMTGEARSRADLGLPGNQQALADAVLDTGRPVVVLLMNGRPLAIDRLAARAPAILETWFLGVEAGPAIADVLTGRVNPAGRLPVTFPRASGAVPFPYDRLPSGRPADADPARDTTRYHDLPITPLFPFGHGLSYTAFTYSDFAVRPLAGGSFRAHRHRPQQRRARRRRGGPALRPRSRRQRVAADPGAARLPPRRARARRGEKDRASRSARPSSRSGTPATGGSKPARSS